MLDRTTSDEPAQSGGALRDALRRARAEAADQSDVVIDMRYAEIARLEILRDALEPVFAQVPREIDIFDVGLAPGDRPRLFVDMVAFIEMGRDRRAYQFMRDGRHGRSLIAESERLEPIVEAVTAYVARRLIERERLLADDDRLALGGAAAFDAARPQAPPAAPTARPSPDRPLAAAAAAAVLEARAEDPAPVIPVAREPVRRKRGWVWLLKLFVAFVIGAAIGGVVVIGLITAVAKGLIPV